MPPTCEEATEQPAEALPASAFPAAPAALAAPGSAAHRRVAVAVPLLDDRVELAARMGPTPPLALGEVVGPVYRALPGIHSSSTGAIISRRRAPSPRAPCGRRADWNAVKGDHLARHHDGRLRRGRGVAQDSMKPASRDSPPSSSGRCRAHRAPPVVCRREDGPAPSGGAQGRVVAARGRVRSFRTLRRAEAAEAGRLRDVEPSVAVNRPGESRADDGRCFCSLRWLEAGGVWLARNEEGPPGRPPLRLRSVSAPNAPAKRSLATSLRRDVDFVGCVSRLEGGVNDWLRRRLLVLEGEVGGASN